VRAQLSRVDSDLARLTQLQSRLRQLAESVAEESDPAPEQLLNTMEAMMNVRLDQIYTGSGDSGETELADGRRVPKSDPTLGAADLEEVSSHLAAAIAAGGLPEADVGWLRRIQNDLLDLGADLAYPFAEGGSGAKRIDASYVKWLEEVCESAKAELDSLSSFALPSGPAPAPQLHLARTVCRRVERQVVAIADVNPEVLRYLNRLSDLLFILARRASASEELLWKPGAHAPANSA
jgi:cob(I)alamin adenosyltransferase